MVVILFYSLFSGELITDISFDLLVDFDLCMTFIDSNIGDNAELYLEIFGR
jgi:hypothetical protein